MSLFDYRESQQIMMDDPSFDALIMAAMRKADSDNIERLKMAFPEIHTELVQRYNAPGGCLNQAEIDWLMGTLEERED